MTTSDKTNNLALFLKDLADTIRANDGTTANINPQNFSSRISLEDEKEITPSTEEQIIKPSSGKYGLKKVKVKAVDGGEATISLDTSKTNSDACVNIKLFDGVLGKATTSSTTPNNYVKVGTLKIGYNKPKKNYKASFTKNGYFDNNNGIIGFFEDTLEKNIISGTSADTINNELENIYFYGKKNAMSTTIFQPNSSEYTYFGTITPTVDTTVYLTIDKGVLDENKYITIPSLSDLQDFAVDDNCQIYDEKTDTIPLAFSLSPKKYDISDSDKYLFIPRGFHNESKYYTFRKPTQIALPTSTNSSATSGYTNQIANGIDPSTNDQYINIPKGYIGTDSYYKINKLTSIALPTSTNSSATSGYTNQANIDANTENYQYINIPKGYNGTNSYYKINKLTKLTLTNLLSNAATSGESTNWTKIRDITINDLKGTEYKYIDIPVGYNNTNSYYKIEGIPTSNWEITSSASYTLSTTTISSGSNDEYINIPKGYNENDISIKINKQSDLDGNASAENVLNNKTFFSSSYTKQTGTMPDNGAISETITSQNGEYTIPKGYHNGNGKVKATLAASNLPSSISNSAANATPVSTISISTNDQYINVSEGYYNKGTYKINAVNNITFPESTSGSANGYIINEGGFNISTSDKYINIPAGYNSSAKYYKLNGAQTLTFPTTLLSSEPQSLDGALALNVENVATITPSTGDQYLAFTNNGYYEKYSQNAKYYTIKGDSNLVSRNIVNGVTIFGVRGSYDNSTDTSSYASSISIRDTEDNELYQSSVGIGELDEYTQISKGRIVLTNDDGDEIGIIPVEGVSNYNVHAEMVEENLYYDSTPLSEIVDQEGQLYINDSIPLNGEFDFYLIDPTSGDDIIALEIGGSNAGHLNGVRSSSWTRGSSSYISVTVKAPVACRASLMNGASTSTTYNAYKTLSANTGAYIAKLYTSSSYPSVLTLTGAFTANSTLYLYAGSSTSAVTTYPCTMTIPVACNIIVLKITYQSSTATNVIMHCIS